MIPASENPIPSPHVNLYRQSFTPRRDDNSLRRLLPFTDTPPEKKMKLNNVPKTGSHSMRDHAKEIHSKAISHTVETRTQSQEPSIRSESHEREIIIIDAALPTESSEAISQVGGTKLINITSTTKKRKTPRRVLKHSKASIPIIDLTSPEIPAIDLNDFNNGIDTVDAMDLDDDIMDSDSESLVEYDPYFDTLDVRLLYDDADARHRNESQSAPMSKIYDRLRCQRLKPPL